MCVCVATGGALKIRMFDRLLGYKPTAVAAQSHPEASSLDDKLRCAADSWIDQEQENTMKGLQSAHRL